MNTTNSTAGAEILVINSGSSSLKLAYLESATGAVRAKGLAERLGGGDASFKLEHDGQTVQQSLPNGQHATALEQMVQALWGGNHPAGLQAIGHRVVHGGVAFQDAAIVDDDVLAKIDACAELAPLHNPANLLGIRIAREHFPNLPQVAVFDTSFHQTIPERAYLYATPREWHDKHKARRYGFHGTSYQFVSQQAADWLGAPLDDCQLIAAHLGNGCSVCAIKQGQSVDTSMGLTPLEGLVMGTRSGNVDANLLPYIAEKTGKPIRELIDLLNRQSGLLGLSGLSNDMRTLEAAASDGNEQARVAIEVFCYRLAGYILAMAAALDRIDSLVFTAGIGENSAATRAKTLCYLKLLRPQLDAARNAAHGRDSRGVITADGADGLKVMVVPTNEEWMIARIAARLTKM